MIPSNYGDRSDKAQLKCSDTQFQLVRDTLNQAFQDQTIKFAYVSENGMLYSHSMFEREWLKGQAPSDQTSVNESFMYLNSIKTLAEENFKDYQMHLTQVVNCLNEKFRDMSSDGRDHTRDRMVSGESPLWSRSRGDALPLMMCVGHTNQKVFNSGKLLDRPLLTASAGNAQGLSGESTDAGKHINLCDFGSFFMAYKRGGDSWNSVPIYTKVSNGKLVVSRIKPEVCKRMEFGYVS